MQVPPQDQGRAGKRFKQRKTTWVNRLKDDGLNDRPLYVRCLSFNLVPVPVFHLLVGNKASDILSKQCVLLYRCMFPL